MCTLPPLSFCSKNINNFPRTFRSKLPAKHRRLIGRKSGRGGASLERLTTGPFLNSAPVDDTGGSGDEERKVEF